MHMQLKIHTNMIQQPKLQHYEMKVKQTYKEQFKIKHSNNWKFR